ncbi:MAG: GNAT family N-acetyltransferase [Myxococcota bacterium]
MEIHPLGEREARAASRLLARAFRDNLMNRAVLGRAGPSQRLRANTAGLRCQLGQALRVGRVLSLSEAGELRGALISVPPGAYPLPLPPWLERLRVARVQGPRAVSRWSWVAERLAELHPLEAHWTLSILGVDPPHTGRGLGSRLLLRFLEQVDGDGLPAYLETDAEANLRFYTRAGFRVVGELELLGVSIWRLRRPAAASDAA